MKNLNALLERRELRASPQSLAPISQLSQQQTDDSSELRVDAMTEMAGRPVREPEIAPPVGVSSPASAPLPRTQPRPPLQPLPSGLSALSESIFEEEKTSKINAIARGEAPPPIDDWHLPPPPAPMPTFQTVSEMPPTAALTTPAFVRPGAKPAPFPEPPPPPEDTPWPESPATSAPVSPPVLAVDPDEAHFQDVFQQFLKVREQCGEPTNNFTYDKFVEKLRKSRDEALKPGAWRGHFEYF